MKKIAILAAMLAVGFASAAQAADPVRIGFSLPLTGVFATAAPSQKNAYEMWRDQVNANGGLNVNGTKRPVEFVMFDDRIRPKRSRSTRN
jgi:branched-chain amino acid transport system substrate-binding protein